jgi:hypothetical protein
MVELAWVPDRWPWACRHAIGLRGAVLSSSSDRKSSWPAIVSGSSCSERGTVADVSGDRPRRVSRSCEGFADDVADATTPSRITSWPRVVLQGVRSVRRPAWATRVSAGWQASTPETGRASGMVAVRDFRHRPAKFRGSRCPARGELSKNAGISCRRGSFTLAQLLPLSVAGTTCFEQLSFPSR